MAGDPRAAVKAARRAVIEREADEHITQARRQPTYADFGLTPERAKRVESRRYARSARVERSGKAIAAVASISLAYLWVRPGSVLGWLGTLALAWFVGLGVFGLVLLAVFIAESIVEHRLDPDAPLVDRFESATKEYDEWKRRTERSYWMALSPTAFEREVASLYQSLGYFATLTPRTGDKGVDIYLTKGEGRIAVQCKTNQKPVGPSVARELVGALSLQGCKQAMLVSRSGFSPSVREVAADGNLELVDLDALLRLRRQVC